MRALPVLRRFLSAGRRSRLPLASLIVLALGVLLAAPAPAHDIPDGTGCHPSIGDGDDHGHVSVTGGTVSEDAGTVTFHILCNPCADFNATTYWSTMDGTATAPDDYTAVTGLLVNIGIANGAPEDHPVVVTLVNDIDFEADESFSLFLGGGPAEQANPSVGPPCLTLDSTSATVTIDSEDPENTPPSVDADDDAVTVDEGETATNTGTFSDAQGNNTVTLSASVGTIVKNDGAGTWSWSFDTSDGPDQSQTVTITATDNLNAMATVDFTLTVNNVPPDVDAPVVSPEPSDEGSAVTASADFTDPAGALDAPFTCSVDYGDGAGSEPGTVTNFTCTGPSHTYADNGGYTVGVCVTDADGAEGCASSNHQVDNVDPTITASTNSAEECGDTADGAPVDITADFTDPGFDSAVAGTLEDFDGSTIDWGDGTIEPATVAETPGSVGVATTGTVSGSHTYSSGGIYTIIVTVEDDDGGSDSIELTALVTGVGLTPTGLLGVVGTDFKDVVNIQRKGSAIEVQSPHLIPDKVAFPAADVSALHVAVCDGDDQVHVNHDVLAPATLDGGPGDDHLRAGSGATILLGGDGADHLFGGKGGDEVYGGAGDDELRGGQGVNVLDGGPDFDHCNTAQGTNTVVSCEG